MKRKSFQVFISSTYDDLREERNAAMQAVLEAGCTPVGMELFPATNSHQWDHIKRTIEDCDYYLVISAGKYGSVWRGSSKSYTEMEFDFALDVAKKPVLAFLHSEIENIPAHLSENSRTAKKSLANFRTKLKNGRVCKFWRNSDELARAIGTSLKSTIASDPTPGWVKLEVGDEVAVILDDLGSATDLGKYYLSAIKSLKRSFYRENVVAEVAYRDGKIDDEFIVEDKVSYLSRSPGNAFQAEIVWEADRDEFRSIDRIVIRVTGAPNSDKPHMEEQLLDTTVIPRLEDGNFRVVCSVPNELQGDGMFVSILSFYSIEKRRLNSWRTNFGYQLSLTLTFPPGWRVLAFPFFIDSRRVAVTEREQYFNLRYNYWIAELTGVVWQLLKSSDQTDTS